ncbi:hypothetical protein M2284_005288 [Rhodococcus sp. LBL1]|nr:hypothetical protein [Rhodococcus sp. LBL1]MDH6686351.1 hypothetical protein [Rhodococcus sp. LBL2]
MNEQTTTNEKRPGPMMGRAASNWPNLSPFNLAQSDELLGALGSATPGHPRSAKEMLNIERQPDQNNEAAFFPEMGPERDLSMTADM